MLAILLPDCLISKATRLEGNVGNTSGAATSVTHYLTVPITYLQGVRVEGRVGRGLSVYTAVVWRWVHMLPTCSVQACCGYILGVHTQLGVSIT